MVRWNCQSIITLRWVNFVYGDFIFLNLYYIFNLGWLSFKYYSPASLHTISGF